MSVTMCASYPIETSGGARCDGTTWVDVSDRNRKENFESVDQKQILEKVAALPVQEWNYIGQPAKTRHIGPMAQDFYAAFGVGSDDKTITAVDRSGVSLAAIQGLYQVVREKDAEIQALKARLDALEALVKPQGD